MQLIFLDVDGVLNNDCTTTTTSDGWCFVDDYLVKRLARLVHKTQAKVILSSSWRDGWIAVKHKNNEPFFKELWSKLFSYGIELYDRTGRWRKSRGEEIQHYLNNCSNVTNYVILDDVSNFLPNQQSHTILTNPAIGLTEEDVNNAIAILEGE